MKKEFKKLLLTTILLPVALGLVGGFAYNYIASLSGGVPDGPVGASVFFPYQGGTGTGTAPSAGQLLVGNSSNTYSLKTASGGWDFDELVDSMTLDANTSVASAGFNFDWNDTQISFAGGRITTSGNVGIGTTTPRTILDINGTTPVLIQDTATSYDSTPGSGNLGLYLSMDSSGIAHLDTYFNGGTNTQIAFGTNTSGGAVAERMRITNTGNIGIGDEGSPDAALDINPTSTYTGPLLIVASGSNERFRVTSAGNVGIGTTAPSDKLTVVGAADFKGTASASYGIITNAFHAANGQAATVSYSRFGTGTTGHSLAAADDLLITGLLEVDDQAYFDSTINVGAMSISSGVTWTTTGQLTIGDGGDAIVFATSNWDVDSSGVFSGLAGLTSTGVIDFGGASSFEIPSVAGAITLDAAGEIGISTGSGSFGFYDGTAERTKHNFECKTFTTDAFSTKDQWGGVKFREPATIFEVSPISSHSGTFGWTLRHGAAGSVTTNLFSEAYKKASSSTYPEYTSFADATLGDNSILDFVIASTSAGTGEFAANVCWRWDSP